MTKKSFITWVSDSLGVGPAPMSYAMLEHLQTQGVGSILNLCEEFPDLPGIQKEYGFDVYYLPIQDEGAPKLEDLEKALAWLDEAVYLGKKTYIHCRHGIGRTGTVLNAYLLRRGLGHRGAYKILKKLRSKPESFDQWWSIRKYGRKSGRLKIRQPCLESKNQVDLIPFFMDYEELVGRTEELITATPPAEKCGRDNNLCCKTSVSLTLVEGVYLGTKINTALKSDERQDLIQKAFKASTKERKAVQELGEKEYCLRTTDSLCPLWQNKSCMLFEFRPFQCRLFGLEEHIAHDFWAKTIAPALDKLSNQLYFAFVSEFPSQSLPKFSLPDIISGKYVQTFFHLAAGLHQNKN